MTFEEMYEKHRLFLLRYAQSRFHVPLENAREIVHDAYLGFLGADDIAKPKEYLLGAVANGCRTYWRRERRELPAAREVIESRVLDRVIARDVLRRLPRRERVALWLRHAERCTIREVANRIGYSIGGTEKLLRRAKRRAAALLDEGEESERWRVGGRVVVADNNACRLIYQWVWSVFSSRFRGVDERECDGIRPDHPSSRLDYGADTFLMFRRRAFALT